MRIACVNYEPVSLYRSQGWSSRRLAAYYNPNGVADVVTVFARNDNDWVVEEGVCVVGFSDARELWQKAQAFEPDIVRCYEAFRPTVRDALRLAERLDRPSYLSLHDMRLEHPRFLARYDMITAYTHELATRVAEELGRPVDTQLNGVDTDIFRPRSPGAIDARVREAPSRIFTIGRRDPVKNVETAIAATTVLAEAGEQIAHAIAGPGSEEIEWDGVHLGLGPIDEQTIVNYLNWCSCFLQVQLVTDIGVAAAEALLVGRPVIVAGGDGGNAQSLIDNQRGIVVPRVSVQDPQAVAAATRSALEREYHQHEIRSWAMQRFSASQTREEEAARYQRLLADGAPDRRRSRGLSAWRAFTRR